MRLMASQSLPALSSRRFNMLHLTSLSNGSFLNFFKRSFLASSSSFCSTRNPSWVPLIILHFSSIFSASIFMTRTLCLSEDLVLTYMKLPQFGHLVLFPGALRSPFLQLGQTLKLVDPIGDAFKLADSIVVPGFRLNNPT